MREQIWANDSSVFIRFGDDIKNRVSQKKHGLKHTSLIGDKYVERNSGKKNSAIEPLVVLTLATT